MNAMLYISTCVIFMGAVQGLFFAFVLLTLQRGRTLPNRILAMLLILVSIGFFSLFGLTIFKNLPVIRVFRFTLLSSISVLPVLFFYIRTLINKTFRFSGRHLLHLLAVLLPAVVLIFSAPDYDISALLSTPSFDHRTALRGLWILYAGPYLLSIYLLLKSHNLHMSRTFQQNCITDWSRFYLYSLSAWIWTLLIAFFIYWILSALSLLMPNSNIYKVLVAISAPLMIYVLAFNAIQKPELFFRSDRPR
jgi:hypothetical protein